MRILILSKDGDGLGIAYQMVLEGHVVDVWIQDPRFKDVGIGLVNRPTSWRSALAKADLIIADMVGFGYLESILKRMNKVVFGLSKITDVIELDRERGIAAFKSAGIKYPQTMAFPSPLKAKAVLDLWEDPGYAVKPSGNIDTGKTYIVRDKETLSYVLSTYDKKQALIVQKIVEGIEVSTEGWWNGRDWIKPFNHTFEEKRFLQGELGPNTGCMGNVVIAAKRTNKLVEETILKLTPFLKKTPYRGPIDINAIVNSTGVYALEITGRLGYDAIEALTEGLQEPLSDVIFETAIGIKKEMKITMDFLIAVRLTVPPWPHAKPDKSAVGRPIGGLNPQKLKHLFLTDVNKKGDVYTYAGGDGVVLKAVARGRDVREAQRRVYKMIKGINILDLQYRTDIGNRVSEDMKQLKAWGYL